MAAKIQAQPETQVRSIEVPKDVAVKIEGKVVSIKGQKGELVRDFSNPKYNRSVTIEQADGIEVKSVDRKTFRAVAGTIESHIRNMILGVTAGFEFKMKIIYSHFPITVAAKGDEIHIKNFLGEKGARIARLTKGCSFKVEKDEIILTGIDIETVGQTVQRIEQACRLSGRDRRIFQDGIFLVSRALQNGRPLKSSCEGR